MGKNATGRDLRPKKTFRIWTMPVAGLISKSKVVRVNLNGGKTIGPYTSVERLLKAASQKRPYEAGELSRQPRQTRRRDRHQTLRKEVLRVQKSSNSQHEETITFQNALK
jgi:hypothetical protein